MNDEKTEMSENWRSRYRENIGKVKTGDSLNAPFTRLGAK